MTLHRQLLTSKHQTIDITSDRQETIDHFNNGANFADVVLNQINTDRLYDRFFEGKTDAVVLDIGGNIGLFSLYVQDSVKQVIAVEPTPNHFAILSELTADYPTVTLVNRALHSSNEDIAFYISGHNSTMNSTVNQYGERVTVKGITLASLLEAYDLDSVDFVKCDIEGSEMAALTDETIGAVALKIKEWFIEVHATDRGLEENRRILAEVFKRQGYSVDDYRVDGLHVYKS